MLSMHQMNQSDETYARRMLLWVSSIVTLLITPLITTHETKTAEAREADHRQRVRTRIGASFHGYH